MPLIVEATRTTTKPPVLTVAEEAAHLRLADPLNGVRKPDGPVSWFLH
ncbi:hypothetical protein GCM10010156_37520 [Planobispora rosea]|uniref:Uncharacterized protein n=1 Tax=Planobispora rosea TaxID=35762 RepID=A0A8J3WAI0_PLARO|nr:hypothetical protein [Planobispora rosea]GGS75201.1 hypothetical protein GCM10010156_37520 [Planobispora rosea]GIH81827.1 hypothetical protein Pro02_02350 [Planobispora rosea]